MPRRLELVLTLILVAIVPLVWRPVATSLARDADASYLPALEAFRERRPFNPSKRDELLRWRPEVVLIGDSMLGSRINPYIVMEYVNKPIWWVMQPGTGSAYWYLAFKNYVLTSEPLPRMVFFFFRDDNLTDPLFRLEAQFRWAVDEAARDMEPELNQVIAARLSGPWYTVHHALNRVYDFAPVAEASARFMVEWPARWLAPEAERRPLLDRLNDRFALDKLRPLAAADMAATDAPTLDFSSQLATSLLPEIIRLAREHDVGLGFIRVQRRPEPDGPPRQSEALVHYVEELERYVEGEGALFFDDTGDPNLTLDRYSDGDHTAGRYQREYTQRFIDLFVSYLR